MKAHLATQRTTARSRKSQPDESINARRGPFHGGSSGDSINGHVAGLTLCNSQATKNTRVHADRDCNACGWDRNEYSRIQHRGPLLFRSLPYPHADRLVSVGITGPIDTNEFMLGHSYIDWRREQTPFQSMTSIRAVVHGCDLGEQNAIRINCIPVEANFLSTLGISPLIGHDFTRALDRPGAPRVAIISYSLWRSRFGGNPNILGRIVELDDQPVRIQGVLPRGFEMPQLDAVDVLMPEQLDEAVQRRSNPGAYLRGFARLKPGVSIERARQEMLPLFQASLKDVPLELRGEVHLMVRSLRDRQIHVWHPGCFWAP